MPDPAVVDAARECEADVFLDRHKVARAEMRDEYAAYEDVSAWLAVVDGAGEVRAGSRLLPPNPVGLKSVQDIGRPPWSLDPQRVVSAARLDLSRTWDIATMFRRRGSGALPMTAALCHGIMLAIRENHGVSAVANLDAVVRAMLERAFGLRWHTMPGATRQWYIGGYSDPVYNTTADLLGHSRRVHPLGYRMYAYGEGLDGIDLPPVTAFRIGTTVVDLRPAGATQVSVGEDLAQTGAWRGDVPRAG